ncbi:hypothetical protein L1N85_15530 [Paenibacillus alkaliterrae]|uniref:hypothetical protein n=1 Tax=Paenibacillus alkaliterrae TaxID=320909 RepID=UPI001F48ECED|nr:hypothetical protein [Paenibacillus alkaliterrae]MCF2939831.1 hypothetical protein [Paenibacillus alkaliterrae]
MDVKKNAGQIRELIEKLFLDAGFTAPELLAYVDKLEQDNAELSQTVKKLKLAEIRRVSASAGMSSRLTDALRE